MSEAKKGSRIVRFEYGGVAEPGLLLEDGRVEVLDAELQPTGTIREGARLLAPTSPHAIWCVGLNYREHAKETNKTPPEEPCIFLKPLTCLAAHNETIRFPSWAGRIDYEGELAVVLGKTCRNVPEAEALKFVRGYACFNDVTARTLQGRDGQWTRAKSFDGFAPMGPCLLYQPEMPQDAMLTTRLNGEVVQQGPLSDMIFSVSRIIAHISRFATLHAGDVIATGTPSGIGPVKDGDEVEVEITGIGVLCNRFVEED
ncbi:MAG: fumarylacetoacetate hydrolase family protein [Fretibacterium sp.]|nr:fumarylacetoacetate hydrolase family protein [Fretibacterium sp.]